MLACLVYDGLFTRSGVLDISDRSLVSEADGSFRQERFKCVLAVALTLGAVASAQAEAEHGPKLSALLDVVKDGDDVRSRSSRLHRLVNDLGNELEHAIPVLIDLLTAPESDARAGAALSRGFLGPHGTKHMFGLTALLHDEAWHVRFAAASALGQLGPLSRSSAPALVVALADQIDVVGYAAGLALVKIDESLPLAVTSDLVAQMHDENPNLRLSAIVSLAQLGNGLTSYRTRPAEVMFDVAGPALIATLKDGNDAERSAAATALKQIAKHLKLGWTQDFTRRSIPKAPVLALTAALTDEAPVVRRAAADALSEVGVKVEEVAPALIRTLGDSDPEVREAAATALSRLGWLSFDETPAIADAIPVLIELRNDPDWRVRAGAVLALGRMRVVHQDIVKALVLAFRDEDSRVRHAAAMGIFEVSFHVQYIHGPPYVNGGAKRDHLGGVRRDRLAAAGLSP